MRAFTSWPRPLLFTLAVLFAAAAIFYGALWMHYVRAQPSALLGVEFTYSPQSHSLRLDEIVPGSAADRVGLRPGDHIRGVNGRPLTTLNPFYDHVVRGQPGDRVTLTVERAGEPTPLTAEATLGPPPPPGQQPFTQWLALQFVQSYPILFLSVGLPVLFLRLRDPHAWLLALLFAGLIASAPVIEGHLHPGLRGFVIGYALAFGGLTPAVFYYFFAVFPVSSPFDRRLPWLKTVLLSAAVVVWIPLALWGFLAGSTAPLPQQVQRLSDPLSDLSRGIYFFGAIGLGVVSLLSNLRSADAAARRRIRVMVYGTVAGITPVSILTVVAIVNDRRLFDLPFWVWTPAVLALFLLPLSFAYAVVKHRVLAVPVLLKRSARYLLVQRGFAVLIFFSSLAVALVVGLVFVRVVIPRVEFVVPVSVGFGISFGLLLAWAGTRVERHVTERIDRAFFRSAYDARHILEDLAEKTRTVASREELAALVQFHLNQALLPRTLVVYLENNDRRLEAERARVLAGLELVPPDLPLLETLAHDGRPCDVPPPRVQDAPDISFFAPLQPDCLVPVLARDGHLIGLVVLGPRLSEEPYSREDKRLLASAASQVGITLDSIRLAEDIARRLQAEQRLAHEMAIAKQVQEKLLPQNAPPMATLDYTGACIQARTVGGDYYDFLNLGPGRLGLVLGDIAGKGISAALLMANLQANLRSQYALAVDDLPRLLRSVNRLFYDSTSTSLYATFFFGFYDDATRRLRYANCGHNPPIVLRTDGSVARLEATTTVLGLFEDWECDLGEITLAPGDTLVIYSDGATEAMSDAGEEFGDARLVEAVRAHAALEPSNLLSTLVRTVQTFSGREQEDDLTLLVARAR